MSEYRIRPHWPRKIVSVYLGVLLVMGCGAVAGQKRQVDVVASIPAILLGGYVVVAVWRNRAEVTAGPKGIRVWFGPMILGERERWIGREEIAAVCVRDFTVHSKNGGRFRTAGVVLRDGDTFDLYVSCPPHPETEGEAVKIAAALGGLGRFRTMTRRGSGGGGERRRWCICGAWRRWRCAWRGRIGGSGEGSADGVRPSAGIERH